MTAILYSSATSTAERKERSEKKNWKGEKALHQAGLRNQRRHQTQNRSLVKALIARGITLAEMLLQAWCWFKTPVIMGQSGWRSEMLTPPDAFIQCHHAFKLREPWDLGPSSFFCTKWEGTINLPPLSWDEPLCHHRHANRCWVWHHTKAATWQDAFGYVFFVNSSQNWVWSYNRSEMQRSSMKSSKC